MKILFISLISSLIFVTQAFAFNGNNKLCWDANTETDLAGYMVYVGSQSGTATGVFVPDIINGKNVVLTSTPLAPCDSIFNTYIDDTGNPLVDGQYFMLVTAYDTSANVSGNSNEVSVPLDLTPPVGPANAHIE